MDVKMPEKNYSPKLRLALNEIETVLKRHDIMGLICLESGEHAEFKFHMETSWSMVEWIRDPGDEPHTARGIKFKLRKDPELHRNGELTTGAFMSLRSISARFFQLFDETIKQMREKMDIDYQQGPINNEDRV